LEAGIVLQGWEVKSLRAGKAQLSESYVVIQRGEAFLINAHIAPLKTVSTHITASPDRSRKLLLKQSELDRLIGAVQQKGYTLVPLDLHWKHNRAKVEIALARGKNLYDKRQTTKERDWKREQQKLAKQRSK
jgi:SsrA-binding protein